MKITMNQMKIISFEVSDSSRNNWINVSDDIRPDPLLSACRLARLLLSGWKQGCKENKNESRREGSNKEAKKFFVIEPKNDIRDAKDTKDAEDVRLWADFASRCSRYATLTG
jgi:hypothetical protein